MSILNVNQIQPVGSGQTVTISATNIDTGSATFTGGSVGIGTDNPGASLDVVSNSSAEGIRVRGRSSDSIGSLYFYNHTSATRYGLVQGRSTDFRLGSESNTPVIFNVNGSEVARFNTSGNLAFPSGTGIDFSATSDGSGTTTSELLDDYEEGTWTPTAGSGATLSSVVAVYVKIGKLVYASCTGLVSTTGSPPSGHLGGLPFSGSSAVGAHAVRNSNNLYNSFNGAAYVSGTTIFVQNSAGTGSASFQANLSNVGFGINAIYTVA